MRKEERSDGLLSKNQSAAGEILLTMTHIAVTLTVVLIIVALLLN